MVEVVVELQCFTCHTQLPVYSSSWHGSLEDARSEVGREGRLTIQAQPAFCALWSHVEYIDSAEHQIASQYRPDEVTSSSTLPPPPPCHPCLPHRHFILSCLHPLPLIPARSSARGALRILQQSVPSAAAS
eukprot:8883729-Pyramimonas_sp.AAC.1